MNHNFLKVNELLANVPPSVIKKEIEQLEQKKITKSNFQENLNKIIVARFKEEEMLKAKIKLNINPELWDLKKSSSPLLKRLSNVDLVHVFQFLDLYSVYALSVTEKFFYKMEKSDKIYKQLCAVGYKTLPQVEDSLYNALKMEILRFAPMSMDELTKVTIVSDIRRFLWGKDPATIKNSKKYFQQYKGTREIFFKLPRLRFDGYYVCCETYFRKGQMDMTSFFVPLHYIKSYRYLRFYDNGMVLYLISTRKFTEEDAAKYLTFDHIPKNKEKPEKAFTMMVGEFILSNNKLFIKMPDKAFVNEMEHRLMLDEDESKGWPGITYLKIVSHHMRDMETGRLHQMERDIAEKDRHYYFKRTKGFLRDVTNSEVRALYSFN
jgi:hypothetical protein